MGSRCVFLGGLKCSIVERIPIDTCVCIALHWLCCTLLLTSRHNEHLSIFEIMNNTDC